jgi:hypothetical protein
MTIYDADRKLENHDRRIAELERRADVLLLSRNTHTVTGCRDCPFLDVVMSPDFGSGDYRGDYCTASKTRFDPYVPEHGTPEWCPLREGDVVVKLKGIDNGDE